MIQIMALMLLAKLAVLQVYCQSNKRAAARPLCVGLIVSLITLPAAWELPALFVAGNSPLFGFFGVVLLGSILEGAALAWLGKLGWPAGLLVSFATNAASIVVWMAVRIVRSW